MVALAGRALTTTWVSIISGLRVLSPSLPACTMQRALPAVRSTGSRTMFSSISVRQLRIAHLGRLFATAGNADVDVPEIGWLWQTPQGARATKAKLMKDRFTPKK